MTTMEQRRLPMVVKQMNDEQWLSLKAKNQLPHAFLVTGLPGLGKKQLVSHYTELLFCQNSIASKACHQCGDCQLLSANSHPDFVIIEPAENSTLIKVDQIRSLQTFLRQTPQQGHYRIVCIAPADKLHPGAANSLLKVLEEPGDKTLIFLVSSRPSQLLPTIKSRCFAIKCFPPTFAQAYQWLQANLSEQSITLSEQQCEDYLIQTGMAPLAALSLAMNDNPLNWQDWLNDLAQTLLQQQSPVSVAEKWQSVGLDDLLISWLQACYVFIRYCQSGEIQYERYLTQWKLLINHVEQTPLLGHLFQFYDRLILTRRQIQGIANPNERLLLESLLIAWYNINMVNNPKSPI